jgi:hypothetical protein
VVLCSRGVKAPEDWRSPKPGGPLGGLFPREASWTAVVLYRFSTELAEAPSRDSRGVRWSHAVKAPEDWRSPRPGGLRGGIFPRGASWTAVVLYRFSTELAEAPSRDSRGVHWPHAVKAPEGWRSPRPGGLRGADQTSPSSPMMGVPLTEPPLLRCSTDSFA